MQPGIKYYRRRRGNRQKVIAGTPDILVNDLLVFVQNADNDDLFFQRKFVANLHKSRDIVGPEFLIVPDRLRNALGHQFGAQ